MTTDHGECWLCGRPLGRRVEWHHPIPKSRGGRLTVPLHPICHRSIHAVLDNGQLARLRPEPSALRQVPEIDRFVRWVRDKPPDFHAPTRRRK
ncbi:HNH endonuclease [Novosphingobium panipatense]|uniref:HNH endonuclease n=1 Tax=Novosphingobium panipatense TaxID=428991 RepID=UPI0024B83509|nr:HNH endonuclease [Novosphingobium panipatense]